MPIQPDDLSPRHRKRLCLRPTRDNPAQPIAECMTLISTDHVVEAVMSYYEAGILPPVRTPRSVPEAVGRPVLTTEPVVEPVLRQPVIDVLPAPVFEPVQLRPSTEPSRVQRDVHMNYPAEVFKIPVQRVGQSRPELALLDNPIIGGRFTVCMLAYGDHLDLAQRCMGSVLSTLPRDRIDLRLASNMASPATVKYLRSLEPDQLYVHENNDYKYPVMREMFWDPNAPLTTAYVVWFDDDTWVIPDSQMWSKLAGSIIANHAHGVRMYGTKNYHDLTIYARNGHNPKKWFEAGRWWRGKNLKMRGSDRRVPNGSQIEFAVGWFWALGTDAIRAAQIPDVRLQHNGGDAAIGCQLDQVGFKVMQINPNKSLVACPSKADGGRRGFSQAFPWADPRTVTEHVSGT